MINFIDLLYLVLTELKSISRLENCVIKFLPRSFKQSEIKEKFLLKEKFLFIKCFLFLSIKKWKANGKSLKVRKRKLFKHISINQRLKNMIIKHNIMSIFNNIYHCNLKSIIKQIFNIVHVKNILDFALKQTFYYTW